jgi:hypothetical protein
MQMNYEGKKMSRTEILIEIRKTYYIKLKNRLTSTERFQKMFISM